MRSAFPYGCCSDVIILLGELRVGRDGGEADTERGYLLATNLEWRWMNRSSGLVLGRRGRADVRPRLLPVAVAPLLLLPTRHSIAAVRLLLLPNALRTHHSH